MTVSIHKGDPEYVEPIKPSDIPEAKNNAIPNEVIKIFNELITKNFRHGESIVKQNDVINKIIEVLDVKRQHIFDNHWLDIEDVYKENWKVEYEQPDRDERWDIYFKFEEK